MLSEQLLSELHKLNPTDKLRIVQILINDLASANETMLSPTREYEVWSPYDSAATARQLRELNTEQKTSG